MAQGGGGGRGISQQFVKLRTEIRDGKRLGPRMVVASQSLMDVQKPLEPEDGRLAVRNAIQDGADFIKVHNTLSKETYFAIVEESKKLGVPLVGHVPNYVDLSIDVCAKAGQKSFEHMAGIFAYLGWESTPQWSESLSTSKKEALYDVFERTTPGYVLPWS